MPSLVMMDNLILGDGYLIEAAFLGDGYLVNDFFARVLQVTLGVISG